MPSEVASGEKPAVLIIGGLGSSHFRCYPYTQGSTNTKTQDTPGGISRNIYMTTASPPKFASSTNTSQSLHGSHQSSRKPAQESASSKLMLHKNVRTRHPHTSTGRPGVSIRLTSTRRIPPSSLRPRRRPTIRLRLQLRRRNALLAGRKSLRTALL
jgi:hypothetical protein